MDECALDFGCSQSMARNVEDVVESKVKPFEEQFAFTRRVVSPVTRAS